MATLINDHARAQICNIAVCTNFGGGSGSTCCGSVIGSRVWGGWEKNLARRLLAGAEARSSCSRMPTRPAMS
jgi:hypothetical protein